LSEKFNPLEEWLGLSRRLRTPNHYQLLALREYEDDPETIRLAADRAIARVRSQRPGERAAQWAKLLDALKKAKAVLGDPHRKQEYDARLRVRAAQGSAADGEPSQGQPDEQRRAHAAKTATTSQRPRPAVDFVPLDDFVPVDSDEPESSDVDALDPMAPVDPAALGVFAPATAPSPPNLATSQPAAPYAESPFAESSATRDLMPPSNDMAPAIVATPRRRAIVGNGALNFTAGVAVGVVLTFGGLAIKRQFFEQRPSAQVAQNDGGAAPAANNPGDTPSSGDDSAADGNNTEIGGTVPSGAAPKRPTGPTTGNAEAAPNNGHPAGSSNGVDPISCPLPTDPAGNPGGSPSVPPPMPIANDPTVPTAVAPPAPDPNSATPTAVTAIPATATPGTAAPASEVPPPTSEELSALAKQLTAARDAIWRQEFAEAEALLTEAMTLARLPEHQAMVSRLHRVGQQLREFRAGVDRAMQSLEAGVSFPISDSIIVVVVERRPDEVVIKVAGRNQTFPLNDLPLLLGRALFEQGTQPGPEALVIKGAFQAVHPRSNAEHREEVRGWWMQAAEELPEVQDLLPFLDDDYASLTADGM
jgi:hypothetical protein